MIFLSDECVHYLVVDECNRIRLIFGVLQVENMLKPEMQEFSSIVVSADLKFGNVVSIIFLEFSIILLKKKV